MSFKLNKEITDHEEHILSLLARGYTQKKIAEDMLFIKIGTLRDEISDLYKKFDVPNGYDKRTIAIFYGLKINASRKT